MAVLTLESLPLGFRFHPTDEELVNYYLRSKINGNDSDIRVIPEVDVCKCEPWDLPGYSVIKSDDSEWFFFSPRDRKYPNGKRSNRATEAGYWKATGKDRSIKARKSGMNLIGMKKTLVFYKGRAPNGERTNWIIHEYRATHKDLQGTKTGQGAFVLCRLFKKADGKTENSSFDEVEPTGSSPATTKSSPVGTPTHLAFTQATPESDMQAGQQLTGIENWFSNSMTSDAQVPLDSWSDCFLASDVEDHGAEVTATKVDPQLEEDLRFFDEPTLDSLDCKVFSPLQSQRYTCQEPLSVDTPFADDFGYDNTEALFKDATSEQDISISEFLNTVLNNQDEYILEESTCQKNSAVKSEIPICTGIWQPPFECDPELDAARRFNGHVQTALESSRTQATFYGGECKWHVNGPDPSFDVLSSLEDPTSWKNPVNKSDDHDETGIEIRTHQPQYQSRSPNIVAQGTAQRRIHLQRKLNSGMTRELNCSMEDHEAKLTVSFIKAEKATGFITTSEPQMEESLLDSDNSKEIARESSTRLRLRSRRENVKCVFPEASSLHHRLHFSSVYIVCVALAIIMFMIFVAVWRCLKY